MLKRHVKRLSENQPFVLAAIISRHGSTPRSAETQMIIAADGSGTGSVGGGFLEARVMAIAQTVLESGRPQIFSADLTPGQAADMDMICGGGVEVLIQRIDPEPEAIGVFPALAPDPFRRRDVFFPGRHNRPRCEFTKGGLRADDRRRPPVRIVGSLAPQG